MKRSLFALLALFLAVFVAAPSAYGQNPNAAQLRIIVVDETGAGIPAATVTITPTEGGTALSGVSDERGLAVMPDLPVGTAAVHVEFPGFLPTDQQLTLRRGANNQTITLKIEGFTEQVTVSDTTATDDRRGNSMSTTLEQAEIEQLPEDPDELQAMLEQMAGAAGATFQVNGFRGGRLPSPGEIQQIRFRTNSFSADNHDAGRTQVEIITRPNVANWSGNANLQYRSDAMNARNALATTKTPEQQRQFNVGLRGPFLSNRTSIRLGLDGRRNMQADTIVAIDEFNNRLGEFVRRPSNSTNVTVGVEHGLNNNQTLRFEFRGGSSSTENNGVGGFNLRDRASNRKGDDQQVRAQLQGVIGQTALNEIRLQYNQQSSATTSVSDAPAIIVQDWFTRGGAGANNTNSSRQFELADNFDFNVGRKQQMRIGFLLEGGQYKYFDQSNANGSFTFTNIDAYLAGTPQTYRQRVGQVNTDFNVYQLGIYWQDDFRVNNQFSFSVGVRNEMQSLIDEKLNIMPRLGFTWTPIANTSIRGGYGLFYDWYETSLYDQTLRVNGIDQQDVLINFPGYPDPYLGASPEDVQPGGRIQEAPDLKMPYVHQVSIGVERQVTQNLTAQVSYQMLRGRNQMRAININQPVPVSVGFDELGNELFRYVRPDLSVGNVTQFESTGKADTDRLSVNVNYRVPQRQIFFGTNYTLGQVKNFTDGATTLPMDSLNPDLDWGPSRQDVRHRLQATANVPLVFGVRSNFNVNAQSAPPYNVTLGLDLNDDGLFNERPEGFGRNAARGASTWTVNMRLSRPFGFGGARGGQGGGVSQQRGPGGFGGGGGNNFNSRYTMDLYVSVDNLFNTVNYGGFSGNMQSRLFGQATSAQAPRRAQIGMGFRF